MTEEKKYSNATHTHAQDSFGNLTRMQADSSKIEKSVRDAIRMSPSATPAAKPAADTSTGNSNNSQTPKK